jgi:4-hydroxy-2-oxoheptanedioate aldolase
MEHIDAVNQAEEIMALPGVDGCFVGPVDLAISLGLSRHRAEYEQEPAQQAALKKIVDTTLAAGKMPCCNTYSPDDFAAQKAAGFQGITMKSDLDLLFDRGTNILSKLKEI